MIQDMLAEENELNERKKLFYKQLEEYEKSPCAPCTREAAVRLLKKCDSDYMHEKPLSLFLPAVSEGTMRLKGDERSHGEQLDALYEITKNLDVKLLAREFLYGIKNKDLKYVTPLCAYYFAKNLPAHTCYGDECDICGYYKLNPRYNSPRSDFYSVNNDIWNFYSGRFNFYPDLTRVLLSLEEYSKLERAVTHTSDYDYFMQIMKYIDTLSPFFTPAKLVKELKRNGGMSNYTCDQIKDFIDMMGYLDIFHTQKARGVVHSVASDSLRRALEISEYIHPNSYSAFPVVYWTKREGIDYGTIDTLFKDIY